MSKINQSIAACLFALSPDDDGAIQLFPAGDFNAPRGALRGKGPWHLNAESAQQLISAVAQRQNDIVIDYEHQSLLCADNGKPVPAAGWINGSSLQWRDDPTAATGLFANLVKWTESASEFLAADEYRYLSPVFSYDAKTGVVLDIINVALTNNPAIDGMQAVTVAAASFIASTSLTPTESEMDEEIRERLLYIFNLPTLATDADIIAELDKAKALLGSDSAATSLLNVLSDKNAEIAALTTTTLTLSDPAQFAPIAALMAIQVENSGLKTELAALTAKQETTEIDTLIRANIRKIPAPDQIAYAKSLPLDELKRYLASQPEIAALSAMQTDGKAPEDVAVVSFELPKGGYSVEPAAAALHARIVAYAKTNNIDYTTAARTVGA